MDLTEDEADVLEVLSDRWEYGLSFADIQQAARRPMTREQVRAACRSLTNKRLAEWLRTLYREDDGMLMGSGYTVTKAGRQEFERLL